MTNTGLLIVIFAGMLLTAVSGIVQHRYYSRTVQRLAAAHNETGSVLVSGRGKGRLRGAIVVLVIRAENEVVRAASVMEGATILARFKDRPDWVGLPARGDLPKCSPRTAKAIADALTRIPGRKRPVAVPRTRLPGVRPVGRDDARTIS